MFYFNSIQFSSKIVKRNVCKYIYLTLLANFCSQNINIMRQCRNEIMSILCTTISLNLHVPNAHRMTTFHNFNLDENNLRFPLPNRRARSRIDAIWFIHQGLRARVLLVNRKEPRFPITFVLLYFSYIYILFCLQCDPTDTERCLFLLHTAHM